MHSFKIDINIFTVLTVLFVILKATGYINWSWWLVFSPLIVAIILFILFVSALIFFLDK